MALWTYSLAAKKAQPFAGVESMGSLSAQFSPDGKWVAYHANQRPNAGASVFLRPYPGTTPTVYPISAGTHPVWRPNSSELFFMRQLQGGVFVTRVTTQPSFATSPPVAVPGDASPSFWRNYDISPDGKLLEVTAASEQEAASAQRIEVVVGWFEELKRLAPTE